MGRRNNHHNKNGTADQRHQDQNNDFRHNTHGDVRFPNTRDRDILHQPELLHRPLKSRRFSPQSPVRPQVLSADSSSHGRHRYANIVQPYPPPALSLERYQAIRYKIFTNGRKLQETMDNYISEISKLIDVDGETMDWVPVNQTIIVTEPTKYPVATKNTEEISSENNNQFCSPIATTNSAGTAESVHLDKFSNAFPQTDVHTTGSGGEDGGRLTPNFSQASTLGDTEMTEGQGWSSSKMRRRSLPT